MTATDASPPRPGDTIIDPSGGRNRVIDTHTGRDKETGARVLRRLLLSDQDGFRFVLHARWLGRGWKHEPEPERERTPRRSRDGDPGRLAEMRFAPRSDRGRERRRVA